VNKLELARVSKIRDQNSLFASRFSQVQSNCSRIENKLTQLMILWASNIDSTGNNEGFPYTTICPADKRKELAGILGDSSSTNGDNVNSDSTISEDFKSKVSTIFEARVNDRISQIAEETEARYAGMLEEAVEAVKVDLTEKVNDYLSYVVEQWIADNEIAIETGLRSELTEDFISGLRNLFAEHYIDVPAEKVDLVEELATKVEELESQLNEEIERGIETKKSLVESRKQEITREVSEGLTATQVEKIKSLAESVEFSTEEEYKGKLETIRENYFPSGVKKADAEQLHEEVDIAEDKKQVINDPYIAAAMAAITKSVK
jgi:hypothetical protein